MTTTPTQTATSLNRRLSVAVVGVTSAVVLVAACTVWLVTRSVLLEGVDRELMARSERLQHWEPMAHADFWRNAFKTPESRRRIERGGPNDQRRMVLVVVSASDGSELHRSSSLAPDADIRITLNLGKTPVPTTKHIDANGSIRVIALPLTPRERSSNDDRGRSDGRSYEIRGRIDSRGDGRSENQNSSRNDGDKENIIPEKMTVTSVVIQPGEKPMITNTTIENNTATKPDTNPAGTITLGEKQTTPTATNDIKTPAKIDSEKETVTTLKPANQGVIAYLGLDLSQVDNELSRMAWMLAGLWFGATLLALTTIRFLHRSVLRPARELATAISAMGPDDLTRRLPPHAGPIELNGVVQRLNSLFGSLEQAFKREQATIANIAHELRTPVASLRTALEFRQMEASTDEERQAIKGYLHTVERMQNQVTNLLLLARIEAGKEALEKCDVHIPDLIDEAIDRWQPRAMERQQTISVEHGITATCMTSPDHIGLVLDNLISNAVAHGTSNDPIKIISIQDDTGFSISVSNSFSGDVDSSQLGQAYYRGDQARSRDDHCGLGLALCQRLCHLLGATLTLSNVDERFMALVRIPH